MSSASTSPCSCMCCSSCRLSGAAVCVVRWCREEHFMLTCPLVVSTLFLRVLSLSFSLCLGASFCLLTKISLGLRSITTVGIFPGCRWAPHTDSAVKLMDNQVSCKSRLATFFRLQKGGSPVRTGGGYYSSLAMYSSLHTENNI